MLDARRAQGEEIAATARLIKKGGVWLVPSRTKTARRYTVVPHEFEPHCTCADHETYGGKCKHIWAVEFYETHLKNVRPIEPVAPVSLTVPKKTYSQKWSACNAAQTHEKEMFLRLLRELCDCIEDQEHSGWVGLGYRSAMSYSLPATSVQHRLRSAVYERSAGSS
jgi:hypothetical protein